MPLPFNMGKTCIVLCMREGVWMSFYTSVSMLCITYIFTHVCMEGIPNTRFIHVTKIWWWWSYTYDHNVLSCNEGNIRISGLLNICKTMTRCRSLKGELRFHLDVTSLSFDSPFIKIQYKSLVKNCGWSQWKFGDQNSKSINYKNNANTQKQAWKEIFVLYFEIET